MSKEQLTRVEIFTEDDMLKQGLRFRHIPRQIESITVFKTELQSLGAGNFYFALFLSMSTMMVGILLSVLITLLTVAFTPEQILIYTTFIVLLIISIIFMILFGVLAIYFGIKSKKEFNLLFHQPEQVIEQTIEVVKSMKNQAQD